MANNKELTRRDFLKIVGVGAGLASLSGIPLPKEFTAKTEAGPVAWADGKYQTFPYGVSVDEHGKKHNSFQLIDLGTLGPDVDTIFGIDFMGDIQTGAEVIYKPSGIALVTRVVGIKRTDLETVQFDIALGGDRFDVQKMSIHGGDKALDAQARLHATNSAHTHTTVVYIGDLGRFQQEYGKKEQKFLSTIIRAQRPGRPDLGIIDSNFAEPRIY
jgi:hypothetical protein